MEARLECKICLRAFLLNEPRMTPRILTECGHTVCEECAGVLITNSWNGNILCPFDRKETITRGMVQTLNKNWVVLDYLHDLAEETPQIEQPEPVIAVDDNNDVAENANNERPYIPFPNGVQDVREAHFFHDADDNGINAFNLLPYVMHLQYQNYARENEGDDEVEDFVQNNDENEDEEYNLVLQAIENFNLDDHYFNYDNFDYADL